MKTIIIPKEIEYLLSLEKRKDSKNRIIKIYEALLYKKNEKNGYFDCSSSYLEKINSRYYKVINKFIEYKIIEYYSKNNEEIWDDIFLYKERRKKYYNTENGQCVKYKFLIDISKGKEYKIDLNIDSLYDNEKWYQKTRYSLLQLGFTPDELLIKRDNFSRRLHTNITGHIVEAKSYKSLMSGGNYYAVDSKTSQPRLLWLKLKEIGLQDKNLNYIFDNNIDFYEYLLEKMPNLDGRVGAKELFASWTNGTGYLDEDKTPIRNIFPITNTFINNFKTSSYKNICRYLQYTEATIFIDDLLENIPLEFALTVHDSILVKKEDAELALKWCKERKPELRFELQEIKEK